MTQAARLIRRKLIADKVKAGLDKYAAARRFKVAIYTVESACREFGVTCQKATRKPLGIKMWRALACLMSGMDTDTIVRRVKVSKQTVSQVRINAKAAGIELPK
jgi:hypothetical protein